MIDTSLIDNPLWKQSSLGQQIPDHDHGVSVSLPCWDHVVGYEENDPKISTKMTAGYPRFWIHREVSALVKSLTTEPYSLPFPSEKVAREAVAFVGTHGSESARVEVLEGVALVITSKRGYAALEKFWQHTGMIVSSRLAQSYQQKTPPSSQAEEARSAIREQLSTLYHCASEDVFLHPTGMGSLYMALRTLMQNRPGARTIQLGFPYVDTLKLQSKLGEGVVFITGNEEEVFRRIEETVTQEPIAALFCEVPTNPMLLTPNLARLQPILQKHQIPLLVDDTIATPFNVDVSPYADLMMSSLTKHLTGSGTVMGGVLACNPKSPNYAALKPLLVADHEELLSDADAIAMAPLLTDFPERMRQHNVNGEFIAEKLRAHPAVERVWYPKWECRDAYDALRTPEGGYSSLFTFLPKNAEKTSRLIYDALPVCKGPSLGTNFTLASPFTLLAHYHELKWAAQYGVLPTMLRISIGLEDPETLWQRFSKVLDVFA